MKRHTNKNNRRLHLAAAVVAILVIIQAILTFSFFDLIYAVILYLGLVFAGHYFCEGDRPSFSNPVESFKCQIRMYKEIASRKIDF